MMDKSSVTSIFSRARFSRLDVYSSYMEKSDLCHTHTHTSSQTDTSPLYISDNTSQGCSQ